MIQAADESCLEFVQGVSYPRSGNGFLVELLANYFCAREGRPALTPREMRQAYFQIGPFSWCEYYNCCQQVPCAKGAVFNKNHDFDFDLLRLPGQRYLIQYRHPVSTVISDFERTPVELEWPSFCRSRAYEWNTWMKKWVLDGRDSLTLVVAYDDLVRHTRQEMVRILLHFGHQPEPQLIPERSHFVRRDLGDYDLSEVIRITRPVREALGLPDLPAPSALRQQRPAWSTPVVCRSEPRLLLVHGLKRSGSHAVVNWLLAHGGFTFCNNVVPVAPLLRGDASWPDPVDFGSFCRARAVQTPAVIVGLEDHPLTANFFSCLPDATIHLLIVRDPRQLFASRIRKAFKENRPNVYPRVAGPELQRVVKLWKCHATELLGRTTSIEPKMTVCFDHFVGDGSVRRQLEHELELTDVTDEGLARVSDIGGGSSFDGVSFDGRGSEMRVLERADLLTGPEHTLLDKVLSDPELRILASEIFPGWHDP